MMASLMRRLCDKFPLLRLADKTLVRFGSVGAVTTTLDFMVFSILTKATGLPPVPSNILSYSCGVALSFLLNRNWTFSAKKPADATLKQGAQFFVTNIAGLILSSLLVAAFVQFLPELIAKLVSIPVVFVWNYLSARFWVFKK